MSWREDMRAAERDRREQDRRDRQQRFEQDLALRNAEAEQARRAADTKRRQRQTDEARKERQREAAKAKRAATRAKARRWLNNNPVTLFVGYVMVAAIVPAVISQVAALQHAGVVSVLAVLLASMLEGGAWALTFMGQQAEKTGRPTGRYRSAAWATAVGAAAIQYWHWSQTLPGDIWVAVTFAASSLFALYLWDLKTHGSNGATKAQRAEARDRRRHARNRRRHHKDIVRGAERLISASPFGTLTEGEAFAAAWEIENGTPPPMTPELYARITAARIEMGGVFQDAEEHGAEAVRTSLLAALSTPVPHAAAVGVPRLGPTSPMVAPGGAAEGRTAQFPLEKGAGAAQPANAPQGARRNSARDASAQSGNDRTERSWEQHMDRARDVAVDLVAEGLKISATSLAKRLKIRRVDAMKLRDAIIAERAAQARPLHIVNGTPREAVSA